MDDVPPAIVIDNGSGYIRSGLAGGDNPRSEIANVLGYPRQQAAILGINYKSSYVGNAAQNYRGILALRYPIEHGFVKSWDAMEAILEHIFTEELRIDPKQHPLLMTAPVLNPEKDRDKMYELLFDKFEVAASKIEPQPLLSLYASGRNTGIVLEIGDGLIQTYPVTNGHTINNAITRTNFGGRDLTKYLADLLREAGHSFESQSELDIVRQIKEQMCYAALDYQQETLTAVNSTSLEKTYTLPDGYELLLNSARFRTAEALFKPELMGREAPGVHELIYSAIQQCPTDTRRHFLGNIVFAGGTTLMPGFADRLTQEVVCLAPATAKVKVVAPAERKFSCWIGGSILASLSTYQMLWLGLEDYRECGVRGRRLAF